MIKFALLSLLISSCSLVVDNFEQDILHKHDITPIVPTKKTYCEKPSSFSLVSEDQYSQINFKNFVKKNNYSFVENAVLWALLQMNLRPDLSSPTSKLQIIIRHKKKEFYINTYTKREDFYPYFKALEKVLSKFKSKRTLYQLASILDHKYSFPLLVSKEFESFLSKNKSLISKNEKLKRAYIRGDETLQSGESLPKLSFRKMVSQYNQRRSESSYLNNNFLFKKDEIKNDNQPKSLCNFDLSLYSDSIFLINKEITKANTFGLKEGNSVFLATSSQKINKSFTSSLQFTIQGKSNSRAPAICKFDHSGNQTWLVSSQSRDPGQHIYHILEYNLPEKSEVSQLDELLKFSRHLFLKSPIRLIIESRRSSDEQLAQLLKLNIPIYNAKKLGKLWGFHSTPKNETFIIDDRRVGNLTCK